MCPVGAGAAVWGGVEDLEEAAVGAGLCGDAAATMEEPGVEDEHVAGADVERAASADRAAERDERARVVGVGPGDDLEGRRVKVAEARVEGHGVGVVCLEVRVRVAVEGGGVGVVVVAEAELDVAGVREDVGQGGGEAGQDLRVHHGGLEPVVVDAVGVDVGEPAGEGIRGDGGGEEEEAVAAKRFCGVAAGRVCGVAAGRFCVHESSHRKESSAAATTGGGGAAAAARRRCGERVVRAPATGRVSRVGGVWVGAVKVSGEELLAVVDVALRNDPHSALAQGLVVRCVEEAVGIHARGGVVDH